MQELTSGDYESPASFVNLNHPARGEAAAPEHRLSGFLRPARFHTVARCLSPPLVKAEQTASDTINPPS